MAVPRRPPTALIGIVFATPASQDQRQPQRLQEAASPTSYWRVRSASCGRWPPLVGMVLLAAWSRPSWAFLFQGEELEELEVV